jgi:hypothetical protein
METMQDTYVRVPIHLGQPDKLRLYGFSLTLRQFAIMGVAVVLVFLTVLPAYQWWGWFGLVGVGLVGSLFCFWAFQLIEGRYLEGWVRAFWQYTREPRELVWELETKRLAPPHKKGSRA